jgi:hypothetical protein
MQDHRPDTDWIEQQRPNARSGLIPLSPARNRHAPPARRSACAGRTSTSTPAGCGSCRRFCRSTASSPVSEPRSACSSAPTTPTRAWPSAAPPPRRLGPALGTVKRHLPPPPGQFDLPRLPLKGLRHTWATLALEQGIHPPSRPKAPRPLHYLDHACIYSHVSPTLLDEPRRSSPVPGLFLRGDESPS